MSLHVCSLVLIHTHLCLTCGSFLSPYFAVKILQQRLAAVARPVRIMFGPTNNGDAPPPSIFALAEDNQSMSHEGSLAGSIFLDDAGSIGAESFGMEDWPEDEGEFAGDSGEEIERSNVLTETARSMDIDQIRAVFNHFDANHSGDLDTFELSSAVAELIGRDPNTQQVAAIVSASGAQDSALSFDQFVHLIHTFDWDLAAKFALVLPDGLYEVVFHKERLGFRVKNIEHLEIIVVSVILDPDLQGKVHINDTVVAVNGAQLGRVKDHKVRLAL